MFKDFDIIQIGDTIREARNKLLQLHIAGQYEDILLTCFPSFCGATHNMILECMINNERCTDVEGSSCETGVYSVYRTFGELLDFHVKEEKAYEKIRCNID